MIIVPVVAYMNWNIENKIYLSIVQWNVESAPLCPVYVLVFTEAVN
jgi:hypothetical protein